MNRIEETATFTVTVVADEEQVVAGTFTIEGDTTTIIGEVPAGVHEVNVDAAVNINDMHRTRTYDLTE